MHEKEATLHLLVGKIAAGKSTLATELARAPSIVLVSEDAWLAALFGEEMRSVGDYVRYSARLRTAMEPHLIVLLQAGLFAATLLFEFHPEERRSIDDVWTNPFGFTVTEYAIRSDRLEN